MEEALYTGDEIVIIGDTKEQQFYYHPDHLGSTAYITDSSGQLTEHLEYFPFGETWVQEGGSKKTPYLYTGKELDQETGLYYYGARYYDPRVSVWASPDPILEKYLPTGDPKKNQALPGMGGVYNSSNLGLYTYSHVNPVKFTDPDGKLTIIVPGTWNKGADYAQSGSSFQQSVSATFGENAALLNWSGGNSAEARQKAAAALNSFISNHEFADGEKLNIVAHSHGGNVAKEYTQLEGSRNIDNLVTLGTPQRGDHQIDSSKVGKYLNIYSPSDSVQTKGGSSFNSPFIGEVGSAGRTDPAANNIRTRPIGQDSSYWGGVTRPTYPSHSGLHTPEVWNNNAIDGIE